MLIQVEPQGVAVALPRGSGEGENQVQGPWEDGDLSRSLGMVVVSSVILRFTTGHLWRSR